MEDESVLSSGDEFHLQSVLVFKVPNLAIYEKCRNIRATGPSAAIEKTSVTKG
jgi:hypothetical protein